MDSVTASAPGRVNLIGEHLDYNGGWCLPIAIDLRTTARVRRADRNERSSDVKPEGWTRYVDGVLAELGVEEPVAVTIRSTVPLGAGLASSAALTCSVALAVDRLMNLDSSREDLARACMATENNHVGVPSGGLDQAAALFCSPGAGLVIDFATGTQFPIPFDPQRDGLALAVVDTRVAHSLAAGEYADRRSACERAARHLGVNHLARATFDQLPDLPEESLRRRARHVVTEQYRVQGFLDALGRSDWSEVGNLMTASHLSLRDDYEVSCAELDLVVTSALAAGALGARMTGAGFGGSAILLCREDDLTMVWSRIVADFARHCLNAPTLYRVEASGSALVHD